MFLILQPRISMKHALLSLLLFSGTGACATATEVPKLKPGLWQMHVQSSAGGNAALPPTICIGGMSDQQRQVEQDNIKNRCSKYESRELDGKWVVDAVCAARGHTITKHTVTSLAGDSYHEENTATQGNMTSDGKWLRPCATDQKPDTFK
jgi:hypothetical protein